MDQSDLDALKSAVGGIDVKGAEFKILDLCTESGLTSSNGEAKKMIQSGALYCNEEKVDDIQYTLKNSDFVNGVVLLRKGKKVYKLVRLSS